MKFLGLTRGGSSGAIAIVEVAGEAKYFDINGLSSLIQNPQNLKYKEELNKAKSALVGISSLEDVPEFESGIPQQGVLF